MTTIAATTTATPEVAATTKLNGDFNMFLKLLTAQMQNQDPLNPMDTAQYTQQLVQYSQVEQQIAQTGTLKSILSGMRTQDISQASSMIGRVAAFDTPTAGLGSAPAHWDFTADHPIASLKATISDANGHVIDTRSLDANAEGSFVWDGKLPSGGTVPAGAYTLALTATDVGGGTVPVAIRSVGQVDQVRVDGGTVTLEVNGQQIPLSALLRIGG